ncbi:polyphosphate kinase 2 [Lutimonas sp.]|jgi:polyphosphate kinase 2|uniref:polyphosphate kinase 2 n=1 Tax=Lutimonas sp. TaxID=1872403 RepID=UPI003C72E9FC
MTNNPDNKITAAEFNTIKSHNDLFKIVKEKNIDISDVLSKVRYEREKEKLQVELVKLQQWVKKNNKRVAIIFEGRDAAGKGGNIRRFTEHLNPRSMRLVALNKPTDVEKGQWYFTRYIQHLPNPGEIVFFDRSWYNRAVVEPVMGFCSEHQYNQFMVQLPEFEHMLYEDGVIIVKFWLSITKEEQLKRFDSREDNPLKRWKFSPVDRKGQEYWDDYTKYKEKMFSRTHTSFSPWIIVKTNVKETARLECMRYVLSLFEYENKDDSEVSLLPDPNVIMRYFRSLHKYD